MEGLSNNKLQITDAIILAALSAYVYFVTFVYEYAFCKYFNIPKSLITPSLSTILVFATAIGAFLIFILTFINFATPLFRVLTDRNKAPYHGLVRVNVFFLIVMFLVLYTYPFTWTLMLTLLGTFLIVDIFFFGIPVLIAIRKKRTVAQGLESIGQDEDNFDFLNFIMRNLTRKEKGIILLLICIVVVSYLIGDGEARKQSFFPTLSTRPNTAVLRIYGDMLICAEYNPSSRAISDSLILFHTTKSSETILVIKEIGPLYREQNAKDSTKTPHSSLKSFQTDSSVAKSIDTAYSKKQK